MANVLHNHTDPHASLVLVCGLPTLGFQPQTKADLESLFGTRFPQSRVIVFDGVQSEEAVKFRPRWIQQMAQDLLSRMNEEFRKVFSVQGQFMRRDMLII